MRLFDDINKLPNYSVGIADSDDEIKEAQILRYKMLLCEFDNTKSEDGIDKNEYDDVCEHLIVKDNLNNKIIGTYRLLTNIKYGKNTKFLCESEFDVDKLKNSGKNILELSRAVVHRDYRNGIVIKLLWQGIFYYCKKYDIRYLFGTASFHGLDYTKFSHSLSYIYYNYMVDESLMCYAKEPCINFNIFKKEEIDEKLAKAETQPLIKGYFSLGCKVGTGLFFDREFNSSDLMMILDMTKINKKYAERMFGVQI